MRKRSEHYEKEFDDEVYEDEFYEENLDEEELSDEDEFKDDEFDEDREEGGRTYTVSYACEECDYRWEEPFASAGDFDDEEDEHEVTCPMCGSAQVDPL